MSWRALLWLCSLLPAAAMASVEDQIDRLVEWQESPLDLRDASAPELELLPGVDADLAEGILQLRALGELREVDDLERVPGLSPSTVELLRPYVRVRGDGVPARAAWSGTAQHREGARARAVHRFVAGSPGLEVSAVLVDGTPRRWRGAGQVGAGDTRLLVGHLRLGRTGGILDAGTGHSRVAPAARPTSLRVRPRTDSAGVEGWLALAAVHREATVFAARDALGRLTLGTALDLRSDRVVVHSVLRADTEGWAASVDAVRGGLGWIGLTVDGATRSARTGLRLAGRHWRAGIDASTTDGPLRMGSDPLTGHRLDREHHCVQLHGRFRASGWSVGALWRELVRGGAAAASTVEFEAVWRGDGHAWLESITARIRAAPQRRITLVARRAIAQGEWRFRFAREATGEAGSELLGAECRVGSERHETRLTVAGVDGSASRVWMLTRPGTGIYPVWVRPPGALVGAGWGFRAGAARLGAWIWLRADARRAPAPGFGVFCSLEAARMVRRLHGSAPSGTGAPSRRSPEARPWRSRP